MKKIIDYNSHIFKSESFNNDMHLINIILTDILTENNIIYSNEKDYIFFVRSDSKCIIWSLDKIAESSKQEIQELIEMYGEDLIICKKVLYDLLKDVEKCNNIYCMQCVNVKKPNKCNGFVYLPNNYDIDILSDYFYEYARENNLKSIKSLDDAYEVIKKIVNSNFYTWKVDKKIVSMASYSTNGFISKIGDVYTIPSERGNGYAQNLIYTITIEMLNECLVPSIYVDNKASYNLYKKIGYEIVGDFVSFNKANNKVLKKI